MWYKYQNIVMNIICLCFNNSIVVKHFGKSFNCLNVYVYGKTINGKSLQSILLYRHQLLILIIIVKLLYNLPDESYI